MCCGRDSLCRSLRPSIFVSAIAACADAAASAQNSIELGNTVAAICIRPMKVIFVDGNVSDVP
jgi:hypothetical protein